ncbi:MAG: ATP-dependent zinc metalloprotease FtsH [Thermodesulfovibrionales bacterium]|jgi:cell division protease FtsH
MTRRVRFSIIYFLIAMTAIFVLQRYLLVREYETVAYSEFKLLLKEGLINDVAVASDTIRGYLLPGSQERLASIRNPENREETERLRRAKVFFLVRMDDPGLTREMDEKGIRYYAKQEVTWFRTLISWIAPIAIFLLLWGFIMKKMGAGGEGLMSLGKSKAKVYVEGETKVSFADVAGVDEAKEELKEIIEFLQTPRKFQLLGGKIPKGVLLVGPPGTGKTLLAKAVAGEAMAPFLSLSGSAFVEMFVGVGAARVRDLFRQAEKMAPCIIFIDEIDALGRARGGGPVSGVDEREQTLTQLLTEMDGFDSKKGVILIAATNRPEILDPALLRPGRFDRQVVVDRPDLRGREAVFRVHAKKVKLSPDVEIAVLASMTPGMAGADIANVVNEAALLAARKNKGAVAMADFEEAIERSVAGLEKKGRVINKKEKEIVAYHECGHAIVASVLPHADPVRRVSIIPRGIAALGYTMQLPSEERYLLTKSELLDRIAVLLGGRAAEDIIFGEVSTGARNDLERAMDMAMSMVRAYGMSEKLGPLSFDRGRPLFLDMPGNQPRDYSEETAREIDTEVRAILAESYEKAGSIIRERLAEIRKIAAILSEKEIIDGEELKQLLAEPARP